MLTRTALVSVHAHCLAHLQLVHSAVHACPCLTKGLPHDSNGRQPCFSATCRATNITSHKAHMRRVLPDLLQR